MNPNDSSTTTTTLRTLLDRPLFSVDLSTLYSRWTNRTILITGAGGSIGSEILRQLAGCRCHLVLLDRSENNLMRAMADLSGKSAKVTAVLGSIQDDTLLDVTFRTYLPHVVIHTAAYKHVPLLETNILQAVNNNVFGTMRIADAACNYDVESFVMVSTDKAVNPTSVMGATKRAAERLITGWPTGWPKSSAAHLMIVRLGNVLGSSGSVLPIFERQISQGGPVTVCHPGATRFFMAPSEAAGLILHAAFIGGDRQTLVLDMGQPINIDLMARKLIRLHGLTPDVDIRIEHTGMRPGEKLTEILHTDDVKATAHPGIWMTRTPVLPMQLETVDKLRLALAGMDEDQVMHWLKQLVPEYRKAEIGATATVGQ